MSAFVNPFVSGRHQRQIGYLLWLATACALLVGAAVFGRAELHNSLRRDAKAELAHFDTLNAHLTFAFEELARTATAPPCTDAFMRELRRVAFHPDGLNEFMYAPLGMVMCSTSIMPAQPARSLGPPDIERHADDGIAVWIDRSLDSVGLTGVTGSVVLKEPFAIVVPSQALAADPVSWIRKELVLSPPDGRVWHLNGERGLFQAAATAQKDGAPISAIYEVACGGDHAYCITMKADVAEMVLTWRMELLLAMGLIAFYAIWPASVAHRALNSYWSLDARFRRTLDMHSIVCAYQPILDVRTGQISGCEVLARWRDVDGSIVPPDKFIDIVVKSGQTLAFTKMVANRAFEELSNTLPQDMRLQINFNIFPRDLDSEKLREAFHAFEAARDRFPLALEIVESDALGIDSAQREIEALARLGLQTYIDDFGAGYSNLHRVASLPIHGVKLDRSFAMAPSESLMARMLIHALDMAGSSGREVVVEGVETQERLDLLVATGRVAYVQGYLISRPVSIDRLAEFLAAHRNRAIVSLPARDAA